MSSLLRFDQRKVETLAVCLLATLLFGVLGSWAQSDAGEATYVQGELLVKFREKGADAERESLLQEITARTKHRFSIGAEHWVLEGKTTVEDAIKQLAEHPLVEYAEPNFLLQIDLTPNDPRYPELYGLHNTGQDGGTPGADIHAELAWNVTTDCRGALVAVIDTGIDYNHPELAANIWTNPGEIADNGIDDDNNGFVDDIHGWDFVNNDNDPWDDHGHGTHVAGTIGAIGNNDRGVVGVCWQARIAGLKFLSAGGWGATTDAIRAVEYATVIGADLTNNSWGGGGFSQALMDAIEAAGDAGQLFVAAAGNSSSNNDAYPHYPSSYDLDTIISVAATDRSDARAGFSSWGATSVDLAAPGAEILSTLPGGGYGFKGGTSMATPHVAGVVALLRSRAPGLSALDIKQRIFDTVDPIPSMDGLVLTGGRVNAFLALADPDEIPPAGIDDLAVDTPTSNAVSMTWTAAGDDGEDGDASFYDLRYSTAPLTEELFDAAPRADDLPRPLPSGSSESFEVTGLEAGTTYHFAIKAADEWGNRGPISNVISAETLPAPTISTGPGSFNAALNTGETTTRLLTIESVGEGTLDWRIPRPTIGQGGQQQEGALELGKGEEDPRQGDPVLDGMGGPDGYGYRFIDSDETGGPNYSWQDISDTGTLIGELTRDDQVSDPIELGFSFPFYGEEFDSVRVCTNGFLSFTSTSATYTNQPLPGNGPENLIAAFWDDLTFDGTPRAVYQREVGRWTVQYTEVPRLSGGGAMTFQITLYASGEIILRYQSMVGTLTSATIGLQNRDRSIGLEVAFNTSYVHDELATRLHAIPQWLTASPTQGRLWAGQQTDVTLTIDASGLYGGLYDGTVIVESNDPQSPSVPHPVTLDVTGAPDITVSEQILDFGPVFLLAAPSQEIFVTNDGTDTLDISTISSDLPVYSAAPESLVLEPRESAIVDVSFAPDTVGPQAGSLTFFSNDPDEPELVVELLGEGIEPPDISVSPDSMFADLWTGEQSEEILTIRNEGLSELQWRIDLHRAQPPEDRPPAREERVLGEEYLNATSDRAPDGVEALPTAPKIHEVADVLLIENLLPWNLDSNHQVLEENSYAYDVAVSSSLSTIDLSTYRLVIVSGDQAPAFYRDLVDAKEQIDAYVNGGGVLEFHGAGWGWWNGDPSAVVLPGGMRTAYGTADTNRVLATEHAIVQQVPQEFTGNAASHGFFVDIPPHATRIVEDSFGRTNLVVYEFGRGTVVASVQTLEWGYARFENYRPLLANMIPFSFELGPGWLAAEPSSGVLAPGELAEVNVTFDATDLLGGDYWADLAVTSNDPDEPVVLTATHLHVTGIPEIDLVIPPVTISSAREFSTDGAVTHHTLSIDVVPDGAGDILVEVDGDFGSSSEIAEVFAEELTLGEVGNAGSDCLPANESFPIPAEELQTLVADGVVEIRVANSDSVDLFCERNQHLVSLQYSWPEGSGLDFGDVFVGYSRKLLLEVRNPGTGVLEVHSITSDTSEFVPSHASLTVPPRSVALLGMTFTPPSAGVFAGTLTLLSNDEDEPQVTLELGGTGLIPPEITVDPESVRQDLYTNQTRSTPLSILNGGGSDLRWRISPEDQSGFPDWLTVSPVSGEIGPGASETLELTFDATGLEPLDLTTTILLYSNDPAREEISVPVLMHVIGTPDIEVSGESVEVQSTLSYRDYYARTIHNLAAARPAAGGGELEIIVNGDFSSYSEYADVQAESQYLGRAGTEATDCSPAGTLFPLSRELLSGLLDDGGVRVEVTNSSSVAPYCALNQHTAVLRYHARVDQLDWSEVFVGFPEELTLRIHNVGTDTLEIHTISTDDPAFVPGVTTLSVPRQTVADLTVAFDPPQEGAFEGVITLHSNDLNEPVVTIPLRGIALIPPDIALSPAASSEALFTGGRTSQQLIVENTGGSPLEWTLAGGSGSTPWLTADMTAGTIPAGDRVNLRLDFNAYGMGGGDYQALLTFGSNDPDESELSLPVTLQVTDAPDIELAPVLVTRDSLRPFSGRIDSSEHLLPIEATPAGGAWLEVIAEGDFGENEESAEVIVEGHSMLNVGNAPTDCDPASGSVEIYPDQLETLLDDGLLEVTVQNSSSVDLNCRRSRHRVRLSYATDSAELDLGPVLVGGERETTLVVHNRGTLSLTLTEVSSSHDAFAALASQLEVPAGANTDVVFRFSPPSTGVFESTVRIASNDPYERDQEYILRGEGVPAPEISVSTESITQTLLEGDQLSGEFTVSNIGQSELYFVLDSMSPADSRVLGTTATFGPGIDNNLEDLPEEDGPPPPPPEEDLFEGRSVTELLGSAELPAPKSAALPDLRDVLANLEIGHPQVVDQIPETFFFPEGSSGRTIVSGGGIYRRGNYISTSRQLSAVSYTGGQLRSHYSFGGGTYFTKKFPGLFVAVADMVDVDSFVISGRLSVFGQRHVSGSILETEVGGVTYYGLVKRIYGPSSPSVNHLVIVADRPNARQTFSMHPHSDYHVVSGLGGSTRLYYLLYAGADGAIIDDDATLRIMETFLATVPRAWISTTPLATTLAPGDEVSARTEVDATSLTKGDYAVDLLLGSTDPAHPAIEIPALFQVRKIIANAGDDQVAECVSDYAADLVLDGRGSRHVGGLPAITRFRWSRAELLLGEDSVLERSFAMGTHTIDLWVGDDHNEESTDSAEILVEDTLPPVGELTFPAPGQCLGPADLPVEVADSFHDACAGADLSWDYSLAEGSTYTQHGDYQLELRVTDPHRNAAPPEQVSFTLDLVAPEVAWLFNPGRWPFLVIPAFADLFEASDEDGALGGIVREIVRLDDCVLYDGEIYGDGDGLLRDEHPGESPVCRAVNLCGRREWRDPVLEIEVIDCGGNRSYSRREFPGGQFVPPQRCP